MKPLVSIVLPVGAGRVAEKDAAAERADGVDGAELGLLKGAAGGGCCQLRVASCQYSQAAVFHCQLATDNWQLSRKRRQLCGRDVKAMSVFLEPAAPSRSVAPRPPLVDGGLDVGVERLNPRRHFRALGRRVHCVTQAVGHTLQIVHACPLDRPRLRTRYTPPPR